jgi:hypothetical protein
MNFDLLIPLLVTTTLAIIGWFVGHHFTTKRDRENKQRDIRITYLVQAYRDLGMAASRPSNSEQFKKLESAFHDIQLFGTPSQLNELHAATERWKSAGGTDLNLLLSDLRDDLRQELNLPKTNAALVFFRVGK